MYEWVSAVRNWQAWDAASSSDHVRRLAANDHWLSAYFPRKSTINCSRHYFGPAIHAVMVLRHRDIRTGQKDVFKLKVKQQFSISGERAVYLVVGNNGLEWSACGVKNGDGTVKKGCIQAFVLVSVRFNSSNALPTV